MTYKICLINEPETYTPSVMEPIYEELISCGFDAHIGKSAPADVYLTCSGGVSVNSYGKAIFLPHGVGDLPLPIPPVRSIFVSGEYWAEWARKLLTENFGSVKENQVKITGWPKLDFLFRPDERKEATEAVTKKYSLDEMPYEKTVLYAPDMVIGKSNSLDKVIDPLLQSVENLKVNLLIKPPPRAFKWKPLSEGGKYALVGETMERVKEMPHVRWIPQPENVAYLYPLSDVMVSDVSSCLREFMVMDKPSIQIDPRSFQGYRPPRIFEGMLASIVNELQTTIKKAIDSPDINREERTLWKKLIFHKLDGRARERVVNAMIEVMGW